MTSADRDRAVLYRITSRYAVCIAIAALVLVLELLFAQRQFAADLLLAGHFVLGLGLGALVFLALQQVTSARWSISFQAVPKAIAALIPVGALTVLLVLLAFPSLYDWQQNPEKAFAHSLPFKMWWLQPSFFLVRAVLYIGVWILFAWAMLRFKGKKHPALAGLFLVVFGVTVWLASYDWLMSLDSHWYSTIFGVYQFAGIFVSALAAIIILIVFAERSGIFPAIVTRAQFHDLGKLLFGFCTFWAYIWYCQYMLIWYVNHPHEMPHYIQRLRGMWEPLFWVNLVLNWTVPFFLLLPRKTKQSPNALWKIAVVVLIGRWLDLYLAIYPTIGFDSPLPLVWHVPLFLGVGALCLWMMLISLAARKKPAGVIETQ